MTYTVTAYDMDHDEVIYTSDDLDDASATYGSVIESFRTGTSGFDVAGAEDGITVALENEDEEVLREETFHS